MEMDVTEPLKLDEGRQEGEVTRLEYRETPYRYTDVYIREKTTQLELKYGCPTSGSVNGKLMKLLAKFQKVAAGMKIDPEKVLVGKEVVFMTQNEETKDGTFIRVVDNSVKPKTEVKEEQV